MLTHPDIGKAFVDHYYATFDNAQTRANLQTLYTAQSMCTYDSEQMAGMQAIMTKLTVRLSCPAARPACAQATRAR